MEVYTIGFTKKSAEQFFGLLSAQGIRRLLDVRLNNSSQLASFAKRDDLAFFLRKLCTCDYRHLPDFAPTEALLSAWRAKEIGWPGYEKAYADLLSERDPARSFHAEDFATPTVLLCSEAEPTYCHRRLAAEYLSRRFHLSAVHL